MASPERKSFRSSWEIPHPPAKVWKALTESNLLSEWIASNDMKAAVGHSFTFRQTPSPWWDGIVHCEVLEVDPPRCLRYTWRGGPKDHKGTFSVDTIVTWTLTATQTGGTELSLEQSGFTADARQAYVGAQMGWERYVNILNKLLNELS